MTNRRPPRIAEWILRHFAAGPEAEVIAGDLLEHYRQGRSRWWYWREVAMAAAGNFNSMIPAVAGGILILVLWRPVVINLLINVEYHYFFRFRIWVIGVNMCINAMIYVGIGWLFSRCAVQRRVAVTILFLANLFLFDVGIPYLGRLLLLNEALSAVIALGVAWALSRISRSHGIVGWLVFSSAFAALTFQKYWLMLLVRTPEITIGSVLMSMLWFSMYALLVLAGTGLWRRRPQPDTAH